MGQIVTGLFQHLFQHLDQSLRKAVSTAVGAQKQARTRNRTMVPTRDKPVACPGLRQSANIVERDD